MAHILELLAQWGTGLISHFGYWGIFVSQTFESAFIPIPSEIVLPFGGYLASQGVLNLWLVALVATLANSVGASLSYVIGLKGGRAVLERYGKYIFITHDDLVRVNGWLDRHGASVAFFSRLLPGVRSFSSLLIGEARVRFSTFLLYTFLGSFLWNLPLAYAGVVFGDHQEVLKPYFHVFEAIIGLLIIGYALLFLIKHIRKIKTP